MGAGTPDPRYFKDGSGLRPNWRYALRNPRHYAWMVSPSWVKAIRFAWHRRQRLKRKAPWPAGPSEFQDGDQFEPLVR